MQSMDASLCRGLTQVSPRSLLSDSINNLAHWAPWITVALIKKSTKKKCKTVYGEQACYMVKHILSTHTYTKINTDIVLAHKQYR